MEKQLTLKRLGDHDLRPPLVFPASMHLIGVEFLINQATSPWECDVAYMGVVTTSWRHLCTFYEQVYAKYGVRWRRFQLENMEHRISSLFVQGGPIRREVVIWLFPRLTTRLLSAYPSAAGKPGLCVTVNIPEFAEKIQAKRGQYMQPLAFIAHLPE